MNIEEIREYCIAKRGVSESLPFKRYGTGFQGSGKDVRAA